MKLENLSEEERKDLIEHRDALLDVRAMLANNHGRKFFKYLMKSFDVGELPPVGSEGSLHYDRLGFLRAGNAIFKMLAEADADTAGKILAEIEKEKYEALVREKLSS